MSNGMQATITKGQANTKNSTAFMYHLNCPSTKQSMRILSTEKF